MYKGSADTRSEHNEVKQAIEKLDAKLEREERKARIAKEELRKLEKSLGTLEQEIYTAEKKIEKTNKSLEQAIKESEQLDQQLDVQKDGLAQQIQALYTAGKQSHLRLLLKQDDPSDIGRMIKYFDYMNTTRLKKIRDIKDTYEKKKKAEAVIENERKELIALNASLKKQQDESKILLSKRNEAYQSLQGSVKNKQRELIALKQRESQLQRKITQLIETDIAKSSPAIMGQTEKKTVVKSTIQPREEKQVGKIVSSRQFIPNRNFSSLRGKLPWPVNGRLLHAYGTSRNEKQRWKGAVLVAPGGRKVKAVAQGKVEFSGWFNGYGYLVIIRHDSSYRSLYGYNRAVYVREGQIVQAGETIAAVGNSGGQQQDALYFEIRKGATTRDPSSWCK